MSPNLDLDAAAVVIASRQGRIEYWSPGARQLFGYTLNHMVGGKITSIIPEHFRARHWTAWRRASQTNEMPGASPIMIPVLCGDGAVRKGRSLSRPKPSLGRAPVYR
jgi:PAS domain S-box-containing protein